MQIYRLCRSSYPAYDGEGARCAGGRWNSKGTRVIYMSENRSLSVLEVLVHLSDILPDKYLLGSAELPDDISTEVVADSQLPENWATLVVREQNSTRQMGDEWVRQQRSAVLSVPSVTASERNYVLNPEHPEFSRIIFLDPIPFRFDLRLLKFPYGTVAS